MNVTMDIHLIKSKKTFDTQKQRYILFYCFFCIPVTITA